MFSCKVCAEKDKRVATLESEVAFLRGLARPPVSNKLTTVEYEADGVISANTDQIEFQPRAAALTEEEQAILEERDRILGGTY